MRVRYSLPIRGTLRASSPDPVNLDSWTFKFMANKHTGYIEQLIIEISDIPKEQWPTLTEVEQNTNSKTPRFPFDVNKEVFKFREIEPYLINLESYLSVFGLEEIEFSNISQEWLPDNDDERVPMFAGFSIVRGDPAPVAEPLTIEEIARCIVASNTSEIETAALAYFRIGQAHMCNHRYIEAVRHLYLCIEYLFANGMHSEGTTIKEFEKSEHLTKVVNDLFFSETGKHPNFERIRQKHPRLSNAVDATGFFRFLFNLRGEIQHASPRNITKWHPSRQRELEDEAICVMNVAEAICIEIVIAKMRSVPKSS